MREKYRGEIQRTVRSIYFMIVTRWSLCPRLHAAMYRTTCLELTILIIRTVCKTCRKHQYCSGTFWTSSRNFLRCRDLRVSRDTCTFVALWDFWKAKRPSKSVLAVFLREGIYAKEMFTLFYVTKSCCLALGINFRSRGSWSCQPERKRVRHAEVMVKQTSSTSWCFISSLANVGEKLVVKLLWKTLSAWEFTNIAVP